jgi:hypothetical protein
MNIPRTSNQMVISALLWQLADELDHRYGPHPTVPVPQIKQIGREMVAKSTFDNKEELQRLLDAQIDAAFSRQ